MQPINDETPTANSMPTPEELAICEQTWDSLCVAIDRLPVKARQAIILSKIEDLPCAEVAHSMGISVRTVEKHVARGLSSLRASVAD